MLDNILAWGATLPPPLNMPFLVNHFLGWQGYLIVSAVGAVIASGLLILKARH